MRMLLGLIGYVATATVITLVMGVGYLVQSERLTDERMFRIVAILHGVELDPSSDTAADSPNNPALSEEPSLRDQQRVRDLALRNLEVKLETLRRHRLEFDHSWEKNVAQSARTNEQAEEFQRRLAQERDDNIDKQIQTIVRDLQEAEAPLAKDLLLRILNDGATQEEKQLALEQTARLINLLPLTKWNEIVNEFTGEAEIQQLHRLHQEALEGGAKQRALDAAFDQIQNPNTGR